jgi:hypothetical protein
MLDTVEKTTTELPLDAAAKRALIETELGKDAGRSDREIARTIGCDHKTVGAARERLGLASPLGNLAEPKTTGEAIARAAGGENINWPKVCPPPPGVIDEPEENYFLPESESLVLPSQPAIAVYTNRYDQIVIRQEANGYGDEDKFVFICPQHLDTLIVRLRKFVP